MNWDGYFATYEFVDPRISNVYSAIEVIVKEVYPAVAQLDGFRWGNFEYSNIDRAILDTFEKELRTINHEFNKEIFEIALDILHTQKAVEDPIPVSVLASQEFVTRSKVLSRGTLQQLDELRERANQSTRPASGSRAG